jgi:hypothetical protein
VVEVFNNGGLDHCTTTQCMGAWVKNGLTDGHPGKNGEHFQNAESSERQNGECKIMRKYG